MPDTAPNGDPARRAPGADAAPVGVVGDAGLRALLEHATDVLVEIDARGTILYISPNVRAWGLDPAVITGGSVFERVHPDFQELARGWMAEGVESADPIVGRFRSAHGDGSYHWHEISARRFVSDDGAQRGVLLIRDVTEAATLEQALHRVALSTSGVTGESFFHSLTDGLASALDVDFALVSVVSEDGKQARTLSFRGPDGPLDNIAYDLAGTPCEEALRLGPCLIDSAAVQRFPADPILRDLGVEGYAGIPLRDSAARPIGILAAMSRGPLRRMDTTRSLLQIFGARASAEIERLAGEAERSRLAEVVESSGEGILVADADGVVLYVNRTWQQLTGFAAEDVLGSNVAADEPLRLPPEDRKRVIEAVRRDGAWRERIEAVRRDGRRYWADCLVYFIRDAKGDVVYSTTCLRDVTREVELETELRRAQRLDALGSLAGGVAHDFNNLLTGILGYASLLRADPAAADVVEAAEVIETAASRAADLTEELLSFSGRRPRREETLDIHGVIEEVVRLVERTLPREIRIVHQLRARRPWVRGDASQLHQALLNLAINARDAMPEGGELCFSTLQGASADQAEVVISVTDTGVGIPPEVRDRVFEPFYTTKRPGEGAGMGLAIVYGVVTSHGGSVLLESEEARGTRFAIRLPEADVAPEGLAARDRQRAATGLRVLVVDDEQSVRMVLSSMLNALGYRVESAADGVEAQERFRGASDPFGLVILDLDMPRMGGLECLRLLRREDPPARVLISTGLRDHEVVDQAMTAGAVGLVAKPYRLHELAEAVTSALG